MPKNKKYPTWGGARKGSGGKKQLIQPVLKTLRFEKAQLDRLAEWAEKHDMNLSEALRAILAEVLAND